MPNISPTLPARGITTAPTRELILNIHPATTREVLNVDVITGKATDTEVPLIVESSNDTQQTANTTYLDDGLVGDNIGLAFLILSDYKRDYDY